MKPLNTRFLTVLITLTFLGFSVTEAVAKKCPDPPCGGGGDPVVDAVVYTVDLTAGAFRFVDGAGSLIDPIYVITDSNKDIGLVPLFEDEDVEMWRPDCGDWESGDEAPDEGYPTTKPDDSPINGAGPWANPGYENCTYKEVGESWIPDWSAVALDQETWDSMFAIGCPELGTEDPLHGFKIEKILSSDWGVGEPGNYRIILRDIRLTANGVAWDVTMQLIGPPNYTPYDGGWLPDETGPHDFYLERGRMWGREIRGGSGGRMSCYSNGSDVGVFDLGVSILEIAKP